ncbi:MAG: coiled-coil domain-containing protein [Planctomycetota bacterium]|jgi:chromosome segregation ATPase
MSAESSGHPAGWEPVQSALADVRATHGEFQQFFSEIFDELGEMLTSLAGREKQRELERQQAQSELTRQAEQLEEDRAALAAKRKKRGKETQTDAESTEHLQRLLEEIQQQRAEMRDAQQAAHDQIARLADAAGDDQLGQMLREIRQQRAELHSAQEASRAQAEQFTAVVAELTEVRFELAQKDGPAGDKQLGQMLEEIRQQRGELHTAQEASRAQAEQLTAVVAELTEARSELMQRDGPAGDRQLGQMLEEIRQQRADLHTAQEASRAQAEQLTAVVAELTEVRFELTQKDGPAGDRQLGQMLEEIRQQRAEFHSAQEASQIQAERLAAVATELTEARSELAEKTVAAGDDQFGQMLEEIRQQRAELHSGQEASQAQGEQLKAVAAELADARCKLVEARNEIARRWEELEARQVKAGQPQADEDLRERFQQMERQQALLEQERTVLESELEAVRNRAAEMAESLADQKRQAASQRAEWADELKRMRRLLESISGRLAEGELSGRTGQSDFQEPVGVAAGEGSTAATGDAVLDSVAAQFEMLQRDLARRRAAKPEPQAVS